MGKAYVAGVVAAFLAGAIGNYALEVYGESDDAIVTITAEGLVGAKRLERHIYEGSIDGLQDLRAVRTEIWATELFGRNLDRMLYAASTPRCGNPAWKGDLFETRLHVI